MGFTNRTRTKCKNSRHKQYLVETLEERLPTEAGVALLDPGEVEVWWGIISAPQYADSWTKLEISRLGTNTWDTLVQIYPNTPPDYLTGADQWRLLGETQGFFNFGPIDQYAHLIQPGTTYTFRLSNDSGDSFNFQATTPGREDVNGDGVVDQSDADIITNAYYNNQYPENTPLGGWANGDFNNNGRIDDTDLNNLATALTQQGQAPDASINIPDSATIGQSASINLSYGSDNLNPLDFWVVDWGDGSDPQLIPGTVNVAQHTWNEPGSYNVTAGVANASTRSTGSTGTYGGYDVSGVYNIASKSVDVSQPIDQNLGTPDQPTVSLNDNATATLYWPNVAGATGYRIEASFNSGPFRAIGNIDAPTGDIASFTTDDLPAHANGSVRVITTAGGHDSHHSTATNFTTRPATPTNLVATKASNTEVDLSWTDNSGGAAQSDIMMSSDDGQSFQRIDTVDQGVTTYAATGLNPQGVYQFQIRAYQPWDTDTSAGRLKPKTAGGSSSSSGPSNTQTVAMLPGGMIGVYDLDHGLVDNDGSEWGVTAQWSGDWTAGISATVAQGDETLKIPIKVAIGDLYKANALPASAMHDNVSVKSVVISVETSDPGYAPTKSFHGYDFWVVYSISGEGLDRAVARQLVNSDVTLEDTDGYAKDPAEVKTYFSTSADPSVINPGKYVTDTGWDWTGPEIKVDPGSHGGTGNIKYDHQYFNLATQPVTVDTSTFSVCLISTATWDYQFQIGRTETDPQFSNVQVVYSKPWSYSWTNTNCAWNDGKEPFTCAYDGGWKSGYFFAISGISGLPF